MGEPVYRVRAAECNGGAYIEGASEAGRTMAEAVRPQPPTGARPTTWLDTEEAAAMGQADLDRMAAEEERDGAS